MYCEEYQNQCPFFRWYTGTTTVFGLDKRNGSLFQVVLNVGERKVSFATMKLTGQASQYWANLETLRELRREHPIGTWRDIKTQQKQKYLPPSYYPRLLDNETNSTRGATLPRNTSQNSTSSSSGVACLKLKLPCKSFLGLELDCEIQFFPTSD